MNTLAKKKEKRKEKIANTIELLSNSKKNTLSTLSKIEMIILVATISQERQQAVELNGVNVP